MSENGFHSRMLGGQRSSPNKGITAMFRPAKKPSLFGKIQRSIRSGVHHFGNAGRFVARKRRELGTRRFFLRVFGIFFALSLAYIAILWATLPDISDPQSLLISQSTVILDRNGVELYRVFGEEDRTEVASEDIPDSLKRAIVAIEDERFYDRGCLDLQALARAVLLFGRAGGASTLTRQLARNALHLQDENIVNRKLKELILGCQLENRYSKDELLTLYLNWIPFGQNAYGVEQASRRYFGISAKELTLAQSAVLAALPQRPTYFSPYGSHVRTTVTDDVLAEIESGAITRAEQISDEAIRIGLLGNSFGTGAHVVALGGRADQVLSNMQEQELIGDAERLQALEDLRTMTFQPARENIRAPHFVLWIREQLEEMLKGTAEAGVLEQGGLTIQTTLDWDLQQAAEKAVAKHREDMRSRFAAENIALVAMDPETKEILAYVGNADFSDEEHGGKVDMARAPRQPGSSFKPFVYAAAFLQGYGPATVIHDVKTKFGDDEPQNFDGGFWGMMTARRALGASRNIPAVKAFFLAGGEDPILELASRMGAGTPLARKQELALERGEFEYGWPLALGAGETPLLEMVTGYSTFASRGEAIAPSSILTIKDQRGALLPCPHCRDPETTPAEVLDPRIAYQVLSILSDVSARPNEYWQQVLSVPGFETAAKTGTSNKCLERNETTGACKERKPDNVWTIGFTPRIAAGVWVGNATSDPLEEIADGLTVAAPIWKDFMVSAHKVRTDGAARFPVPQGLVQPQISLLSGELPTECTPVSLRRADLFLAERAPQLPDPACLRLTIDRVTGLLAAPGCPEEAQEVQSFYKPESVLPARWPLWQAGVQAWAADQMQRYKTSSGSQLPLPVAPTELCDASLTPGRLIKPRVTIEYPAENGLANYPSFQPQLDISVGSSVRHILYEIDDKRVAVAGSGGSLTPALRVPRSIKEEGTHTLTVTLTDQYFNTVSDSVKFRFGKDRSGPSVHITEPEDGIRIQKGEILTIVADAEDSEGALRFVEFFLGDKLLSTKPNDPYMLDYTITEPPGTYILRAVATDLAGNTDEDSVEIGILED